ncbi:MAG TPA: EAL domain-containing protein, partial [Candidatus Caenarcaniphilales bacterium]
LPLVQVLRLINETTCEPVETPVERVLREGHTVGLASTTLLVAREGREFAIDNSAAPIRTSSGQIIGAVVVFRDVTHERSITRQLSWQASHDALTGLVNRREFEQRLEQAVLSARAQNQQHALCYLDLDQFKIVNDTCGHGAGDKLLHQVSSLLQTQVRAMDTLARLGGDEFGVLLNLCSLEQARRIANALCQRIQEFRFIWQDKTFAIGVSIGLVAINADSQSLVSTLSAADAACYAAKNRGRNRVHVYQANDSELKRQKGEMQWVTRIAKAFEDNRFRLYYQPIVPIALQEVGDGLRPPTDRDAGLYAGLLPRDTAWQAKKAAADSLACLLPQAVDGWLEHYEVLLRLQDETGQLVSPAAFIPAAERYNLMHTIDRWVISTLFASQGQHYRELFNRDLLQGLPCNCLYAINLSGTSINDEQFIDFLYEQFTLHQVPPQVICFEITETTAIANLGKAAEFIRELKEFGCRFALDDFGSGMSSFAYLKNLPVDYLKIDGDFVKDIIDDPIDSAMVEAISRVGQVMGIQTIAECVENNAILEKIKALGVDYAQGYGIARPHPLQAIPAG